MNDFIEVAGERAAAWQAAEEAWRHARDAAAYGGKRADEAVAYATQAWLYAENGNYDGATEARNNAESAAHQAEEQA